MLSVSWKITAPPPLQTSSEQITSKYMKVFLGDSCYHTLNRKTNFGCQLSLISPWSLTQAFFFPSFFFLNACTAGLKIKPSNQKSCVLTDDGDKTDCLRSWLHSWLRILQEQIHGSKQTRQQPSARCDVRWPWAVSTAEFQRQVWVQPLARLGASNTFKLIPTDFLNHYIFE